jgi:hypothetical protein
MTVAMKILVHLLLGVVLSGCALAPPYRVHPDLQEKAKLTRALAVMPPKVEVFQLGPGGVREKMDGWSSQAKQNILVAIESELKTRAGLRVTTLAEGSLSEEAKSNVEDTHKLFDAVNSSIVLHTYNPPAPPEYQFEEKIKHFDYSLGKEVQRLRLDEADVLLLAMGVDHIWTEGRKALQAFGVLLGIGAGVATGVVVIPVLGGGTEIAVALLDAHSGSILWYNRAESGAGYDLRDPASASNLVKEVFKEFPIGVGTLEGER